MNIKKLLKMNFQKLMTIEKAQTYLDVAFRAARTKEKPKVHKKVDKFLIVKTNEYDKVQTVSKSLINNLNKIVTKFPQVDELPPFYNELLKITLDYNQLKKSLGAVLWASKKIVSFQIQFCSKLKQSGKIDDTIKYGKEFYGRVSSVMKQIKKDLEFVSNSDNWRLNQRIRLSCQKCNNTYRYSVQEIFVDEAAVLKSAQIDESAIWIMDLYQCKNCDAPLPFILDNLQLEEISVQSRVERIIKTPVSSQNNRYRYYTKLFHQP